MGPGFVRLGGISAFLVLGVLVIGIVISASMMSNIRSTGDVSGIQITTFIINLLLTVFVLISLWASKVLFNSFGYRGGDIPIYLIFATIILSLVLSLIGGAGLSNLSSPQSLQGTSQAMGVISLIIIVVMFIGFAWFAISCIGFGGRAKMGIWKAIGILFLIVGIGFALAILIMAIMVATITPGQAPTQSGGGMAALAAILILIAGLVWIAAIICHGIGLLIGAGRMGQPAPAQ